MCLFRKNKLGYSLKGFWGETRHFDRNGEQTGYTIKGFWGQRKRYDMSGNLVSVTWKNFWGGYNTYDASGNLKKHSRKNFGGGYSTYDLKGNKTSESYKNFWEGTTHFEPTETNVSSITTAKKKPFFAVEENIEDNGEIENANYQKFDSKEILYAAPEVDEVAECYPSVKTYLRNKAITKYAKILVFTYEDKNEFPAISYLCGDRVRVDSLIYGMRSFDFAFSEIERARRLEVKGLDMGIVDQEFLSISISELGGEYEELFPEYSWNPDGISRVEYVFECGLVITEKSMEEIREKLI